MEMQASLPFPPIARRVDRMHNSLAPQSERWEVNGETFSSTADLLKHPVTGPATFTCESKVPAWRAPHALWKSPVGGLAAGVCMAPIGGLLGVLAASALKWDPAILVGLAAPPALGLIGGLTSGICDNLPATDRATYQGEIAGEGSQREFRTQDARWDWDPGPGPIPSQEIPSEAWFARAERNLHRAVPLADLAAAPRVEGNPRDAQQWWGGAFGD